MKASAHIIGVMLLLLLLCACKQEKRELFAFYHWKSKARHTPVIAAALAKTATNTLYLHYFDIDRFREGSSPDDGVFPVSVLKEVDPALKQYDIVPVIFIANKVFKQDVDLPALSHRIHELVKQISLHHFGKIPGHIQLDCDWTESSREQYFELIELLKQHYELSATIRLHQIKYQSSTGVPPIKHGVLMLYNVGRLEDDTQNSILESAVVKQYINEQTTYPLTLDVALPLFSQMVIKSNSKQLRLINGSDRKTLEAKPGIFRPLSKHNFEVLADTLYKGHYLFKGYKIKVEEVSPREITESFRIIKRSKIKRQQTIFYHLDDPVLHALDLEHLIKQL